MSAQVILTMMVMMICSSPSVDKDQDENDSDNEDQEQGQEDQQPDHQEYAHSSQKVELQLLLSDCRNNFHSEKSNIYNWISKRKSENMFKLINFVRRCFISTVYKSIFDEKYFIWLYLANSIVDVWLFWVKIVSAIGEQQL